jgi:hypothetical protein
MALLATSKTRSAGTAAVLAGAATLAALALGNHLAARRAERRNPPRGAFMEVDGVRLHYSDRGEGSPIRAAYLDAWPRQGRAPSPAPRPSKLPPAKVIVHARKPRGPVGFAAYL